MNAPIPGQPQRIIYFKTIHWEKGDDKLMIFIHRHIYNHKRFHPIEEVLAFNTKIIMN